MFGVGDGVAELAVRVEAAGEEVVEQTSAHLLELRNHRLRLRNRLVHRVQYGGDMLPFLHFWREHQYPPDVALIDGRIARSGLKRTELRRNAITEELMEDEP